MTTSYDIGQYKRAYRDPCAFSEGQRQRTIKRWTLDIPSKPDPDVLRLSGAYFLPYGRAKMLKALSYGLFVDWDVLAWCYSRPLPKNDIDRKVEISHQIQHIKNALNTDQITYTPKFGYRMYDPALSQVRQIVSGA